MRDEMAALGYLCRGPMQPLLIAGLEMVGCRIEREQGHPLSAVFGDIAKHSANRVGVFEVVLGNQFLIEALALEVLDEAHHHFIEQRRLGRSSGNRAVKQMN